mgnify:CR=1 FL=1
MNEVIKVIKDNLLFKDLPKDIRDSFIDAHANDILFSFDKGVYTKKTAKADAKLYYEDWEKDRNYVLYHSNFYGIQAEEKERFYENTN